MLCHESTAAPSGPSALSLYQDWKHPRTAVGFTGGQNAYEQNTILRCVTNTLIPCTQELFASMGKMRFNVTVLAIAQTGHAKAPNKKGSGGKYMKLVNSKSLFEDIKDQDSISGVRMFSFRKANSNTDRGDRDDDVSVDIHVGEVLTFWIHDFMYIAKDNRKSPEPSYVFPTAVKSIPEFTIIDLFIMPSHSGNENGYGINVKRVKIHPTTLYSYLTAPSLKAIPGTYPDSVEIGKMRSEASRFIHNQIEVKNTSFFSRVPANAFIAAAPICEGVYRMVGDGGRELFPGVPCVDINESDLLKFANIVMAGEGDAGYVGLTKEDCVMDAITLFDFASAAESLYLYVTSVPTFKSRDPALSDFLGVPMVDSDGILKAVEIRAGGSAEEGEVIEDKLVFPFGHEIVNFSAHPIVSVFTGPVYNATGVPAPCPDFSLMFEMCSVAKGYQVTIGKEDAPDVLKFVFNVMGCQFSPNKSSSRLDYASRGAAKRKSPEESSPDGDE